MIFIRKAGALAVAAVFLVSAAVAQSSNISVTPTGIEDNVSVGDVHGYNLTVENTGSDKLQNVTLGNTSYLNWTSNRFTLNSSETRTVNASIYTEKQDSFNTTLETSYTVNGSTLQGPNLSVDVETYYQDTNATLDVLNSDFELEFGDSDSSAFEIVNTGNETAYNVSLSGGNATFDRDSGFQIEPGGDVLVKYEVSIPKPGENATAATNQSYSVPVTVSAANFGNKTFSASVFVPFKQYDTQEEAQSLAEEWLEIERQRLDYCRSVDFDAPICQGDGFVVRENVTETVYRTPRANVSLTNYTIEALNDTPSRIESLNDTVQRTFRRTKLLESYFDSELEDTESKISSNLSSVDSEVEDLRRRENRRWENVSEFIQEEKREEQGQTTNQIIGFFVLALLMVVTRADKIQEKWNDLTGDDRL